MRRRLLQVLLPLLTLLVVGISVPAATTIAERHTSELVADRINDANRLSVAAFTALSGGVGLQGSLVRLQAELDDYADLYDTPVWLVDRESVVLHATDDPALPAAADERLDRVLAGQTPELARTIWPWEQEGEVIVAPVGRDSQVVAALVFVAPVAAVHRATIVDWGVLGAALLLPLGAAVALVGPTTRWLLRPVRDLERSAAAVAGGELRAHADADSGPPELRTLSRSFNQMVDAVRTTVERQQAFVSDAAHQLRNPVASVRLSVENLEAHLDPADAEARATYDDAVDDLDRMSGVLSGMLAATRFQTRPSRESVAGEVLEPGRSSWLARCADAGLAATVVVDDAATRVVEPTGGLAACADELVANAVRLAGGTRVEVHARRAGTSYRVAVADDGRGLTPEERENATRRFWRSAKVQNIEGTGLGLTILAQVTADAGGRLELADTPGGGLTATLVVPVVD